MNEKDIKYVDAFVRKAKEGRLDLFLAVKAYPNLTGLDAESRLQLGELIESQLGELTPMELMRLFPVKKTYDGDKYGCKDYFYTMEHISANGLNRKIANAMDFLWDYVNDDISEFLASYMCMISKAYREQTGREMCLDGMECAQIPYTAYVDGGLTMVSYDGKDTRVAMPNLPYLRQLLDEDDNTTT